MPEQRVAAMENARLSILLYAKWCVADASHLEPGCVDSGWNSQIRILIIFDIANRYSKQRAYF